GGGKSYSVNYSSTAVTLSVGQDSSAPSISIALSSPNGGTPDGQSGWFVHGPVSGTVSATDSGSVASIDCGSVSLNTSGLGTSSASGTFSIADEGVTHLSCTATDGFGNTSVPATKDVQLDTHAPDVARNASTDSC